MANVGSQKVCLRGAHAKDLSWHIDETKESCRWGEPLNKHNTVNVAGRIILINEIGKSARVFNLSNLI